jgi:spore photoproduct lyase
MRRVERMLTAIDTPEIVRGVTDEQLAEMIESSGWGPRVNWGERAEPADPPVVFNTLKLHLSKEERDARLERLPALKTWYLHGYLGFDWRRDGTPEWRRSSGRICQPGFELHSTCGCPFRCSYCYFGDVVNMAVNIEEFVDHVAARIRELQPPQSIYKWDNYADAIAWEPEYDATRLFIESFARDPDNYFLLYAGKSDNVDFMLDLEHNGRTIIQWSVSAETQSTQVEPETASGAERVRSAAKCQQAGYRVRFRFAPIVPVHGWREEYAELIAQMFEETRPDVVVFNAIGWMDFDRFERCMDLSLIEPKYVEMMRASAPLLKGKPYGPLPHEARAEIYRFLMAEVRRVSPHTPMALCLETPAMWAELADLHRQHPDDYVCVCGPHCTPGNELFDKLAGGDAATRA